MAKLTLKTTTTKCFNDTPCSIDSTGGNVADICIEGLSLKKKEVTESVRGKTNNIKEALERTRAEIINNLGAASRSTLLPTS